MATPKNTNRSKRKYGDGQQTRTARNKASKQTQHEARTAALVDRTQALIGSRVRIGGKKSPLTGTVLDVLRKGDEKYPTGAVRNVGAYLNIRTHKGDVLRSRHRVTPIREVI